jgi:hypothetical protein
LITATGGEIFASVGKRLGVTERYVREVWYSKESKLFRDDLALHEKIIRERFRQNA